MDNILAIIPARGGSKGVPRKNIRPLLGKPLIQYAIDAAKQSAYINKIIVSTDDEEIASIAKQGGAEVIFRPASMSNDTALVIDAIRFSIDQCENEGYLPKAIVLLECTAPIKSVDEIDEAIKKIVDGEADSAASFKETAVSPNRLWRIEEDEVSPFIENASPFLPRQAQPKGYELTGQFYVLTTDILKKNPGAISILLGKMYPVITKVRLIDIDEEIDFLIAEQIIKFIENEEITGTV